MSADEDVPPLEDMSELIKQVDTLRELKHKKQSPQVSQTLQNGHGDITKTKTKKESHLETKKDNTTVTDTQNKSVQKDSSVMVTNSSGNTDSQSSATFGGMKKGFLFGGAPKTNSPKENKVDVNNSVKEKSGSMKTLEDIPFVKKNDSAKEKNLQFSEVQEAMAKTNAKLMENKEWVTDDLLNKLEKNEKLAKRLQDPMFVRAIGEFQTNPTAALQKYGDNAEVQEFFTDFCGLMGEHFNKLADLQPGPKTNPSSQVKVTEVTEGGADLQVRSSTNPKQATAADEAKMQEILSNPEIREVLMDPQIQSLFQDLRTDPAKGERILQTATGELRQKIHILVQAGLLQFQRS